MNELQCNPTYFSARGGQPEQAPKVDPDSARPLRRPSLGSYVVELATSSATFHSQNVPHVDLFDLYHLYSDLVVERGAPRHVLRLGFFSDPGIAKTIARYLASYFDSPRVLEVGAAEQERAVCQQFVAAKDVGASGQVAAIVLTAPRPLPVAAYEAPSRSAGRYRSFWSRLLGERAR